MDLTFNGFILSDLTGVDYYYLEDDYSGNSWHRVPERAPIHTMSFSQIKKHVTMTDVSQKSSIAYLENISAGNYTNSSVKRKIDNALNDMKIRKVSLTLHF